MRVRLSLSACLLLTCLQASLAHAFLTPYVRLGFGGNQLKMNDMNDAIAADVGWATAGGVPVTAKSVGAGFGPDVSAGLWIVSFLRVGAIYSEERAHVNHEYSQVGFLYRDDYVFRMKEAGLEAAVRIRPLAGLTLGGSAAQGQAQADRNFALENIHGNYYEDFTSHRTSRTYAVFLGLDQTTVNGMAGFLQVGYHWREVGPMPGTNQIDDNGTISAAAVQTAPADYSGWSVRLGCGFDLNW